ncbi:hypothetical protein NX059_000891 [Plenodomus lindquistii]|nr:hypothetical protein NX059_000891 [Plenodomus lindquistii]
MNPQEITQYADADGGTQWPVVKPFASGLVATVACSMVASHVRRTYENRLRDDQHTEGMQQRNQHHAESTAQQKQHHDETNQKLDEMKSLHEASQASRNRDTEAFKLLAQANLLVSQHETQIKKVTAERADFEQALKQALAGLKEEKSNQATKSDRAVQRFERTAAETKQQIKDLEVQLSQQKETMRKAREDVTKLESVRRENEEEMKNLKQAAKEQNGVVDARIKAARDEAYKDAVRTYSKKLTESAASLKQQHESALEKLQKEADEAEALAKKHHDNLLAATETMSKSTTQMNESTQRINTLNFEKERLLKDLAETKKSKKDLEVRGKSLENELQNFRTPSEREEELTGKLTEAQKAAADVKALLKEEADKRGSVEASLAKVGADHESLLEKYNERNQVCVAAEAKAQKLEDGLARANERKSELESEKAELKTALGKMQQEASDSAAEASALAEAKTQVTVTEQQETKLRSAHGEIEALKKQLAEQLSRGKDLETKLDSANEELEGFDHQLAEKEDEANSVRDSLYEAQIKYKEEVNELRDALQDEKAKREEAEKSRSSNIFAEAKNKEVIKDLENARSELQSSLIREEQLKKSLSAAEQTAAALKEAEAKLDSSMEREAQLRATAKAHSETSDAREKALKEEMATREQDYKKQSKDSSAMWQNLKQETADEYNKKLDRRDKEVAAQKQKIADLQAQLAKARTSEELAKTALQQQPKTVARTAPISSTPVQAQPSSEVVAGATTTALNTGKRDWSEDDKNWDATTTIEEFETKTDGLKPSDQEHPATASPLPVSPAKTDPQPTYKDKKPADMGPIETGHQSPLVSPAPTPSFGEAPQATVPSPNRGSPAPGATPTNGPSNPNEWERPAPLDDMTDYTTCRSCSQHFFTPSAAQSTESDRYRDEFHEHIKACLSQYHTCQTAGCRKVMKKEWFNNVHNMKCMQDMAAKSIAKRASKSDLARARDKSGFKSERPGRSSFGPVSPSPVTTPRQSWPTPVTTPVPMLTYATPVPTLSQATPAPGPSPAPTSPASQVPFNPNEWLRGQLPKNLALFKICHYCGLKNYYPKNAAEDYHHDSFRRQFQDHIKTCKLVSRKCENEGCGKVMSPDEFYKSHQKTCAEETREKGLQVYEPHTKRDEKAAREAEQMRKQDESRKHTAKTAGLSHLAGNGAPVTAALPASAKSESEKERDTTLTDVSNSTAVPSQGRINTPLAEMFNFHPTPEGAAIPWAPMERIAFFNPGASPFTPNAPFRTSNTPSQPEAMQPTQTGSTPPSFMNIPVLPSRSVPSSAPATPVVPKISRASRVPVPHVPSTVPVTPVVTPAVSAVAGQPATVSAQPPPLKKTPTKEINSKPAGGMEGMAASKYATDAAKDSGSEKPKSGSSKEPAAKPAPVTTTAGGTPKKNASAIAPTPGLSTSAVPIAAAATPGSTAAATAVSGEKEASKSADAPSGMPSTGNVVTPATQTTTNKAPVSYLGMGRSKYASTPTAPVSNESKPESKGWSEKKGKGKGKKK